MQGKVPQSAIWLMWLALPFTLADYRQAWDRLPVRMAVHFNADWHANGWAGREQSLELALGVVAFLLLVFTVGGYVVRAAAKPASTAWAILVLFYVVIGFVCAVNHWVVEFNVNAQASRPAVIRN